MSGNGRTVNSAIFNIILASMVMFTGTAAARPGSSSFGHARYAWPSGTSRYAPDNRASHLPAADRRSSSYPPARAAAPPRQSAWYADASRGNAWGAESRQPRHDYRQIRAENRYAPKSGVAPASAPIPVLPAYPASAAAAGYGTIAGNNPLSVAGLLADTVSALAEYARTDEMYEADPAYDEGN